LNFETEAAMYTKTTLSIVPQSVIDKVLHYLKLVPYGDWWSTSARAD